MTYKQDMVYYNLWERGMIDYMVDMYERLPLSNERYVAANSIEENNKLFLDCYDTAYNVKGFKWCDIWLRGLLADYVKRCSLNDGDAPYSRQYYIDWLNNTRWISRNHQELREWCNDYESWLNDNVFEKVAKDCDKDAVGELHDALIALIDFHRFYDDDADLSLYDDDADLWPIPLEGDRDEVTTRLFSVLEWCKQHDKEFKTQLVNCPLLKDVEELIYICESFVNGISVVDNDAVTLEMRNDIAMMLDNVIKPIIKQRKPTSTPEPTPEPQPSPSVQATEKDDAATNINIANVDAIRLGSFFNAKFKGMGNNYNYFDDMIKDIQTIKITKELAMIAVMIYDCRQYFIQRPSSFAAWLRDFFDIIGRDCPKDTRKNKYKPNDTIRRMFRYLE